MVRDGRSAVALMLMVGLVGAPRAWAGDGVIALQTAAPSCPDDSGNIYVDCGNGTVTDNRTGLVWLANANCIGEAGGGIGDPPGRVDWYTAMGFAAGLSDLPGGDPDDCGLEDGSSPGEWRLPSAAEWEAMIADALGEDEDQDCTGLAAPTITNDSGEACFVNGPSAFNGVVAALYWSASTFVNVPTGAWYVDLGDGDVIFTTKGSSYYVWPVRGGQ